MHFCIPKRPTGFWLNCVRGKFVRIRFSFPRFAWEREEKYKSFKYMKRPSHKELFQKIKAAKKAVNEGRVILLDDQEESIISDAFELGYEIKNELLFILSDLLAHTKPEDYAGVKPPQKSYEREIEGFDLFAFSINSKLSGCRVYYKFSIQDNNLWLVSLHKERKERKKI